MAISKELQDSGQQVEIIGHFSIQTGIFQKVTNINYVHEESETNLSKVDSGKKVNRYTTEHNRDDVNVYHPVSASVKLYPDLLEVIDMWQNLPDSIRAGIAAMIKAIELNQR